MKASSSQQEILDLFELDLDKVLTSKAITAELEYQYYCNAGKYVSERLSKMVKSGFLERVGKSGKFKLKYINKNPNQLSLF